MFLCFVFDEQICAVVKSVDFEDSSHVVFDEVLWVESSVGAVRSRAGFLLRRQCVVVRMLTHLTESDTDPIKTYWNDNSWDWNDNGDEDAANYIGGISHYVGKEHRAQDYGMTAATAPNRTYASTDTPRLRFDIAAATLKQKQQRTDDNMSHYIVNSNFKSFHRLLIDSGASTHVCPKDYGPDLPLRSLPRTSSTRFPSTAPSMFDTSRATSGSRCPSTFVM